MNRIPAWERLRAAGAPLSVTPPERVALEVARIEDGDIAELAGATVFDARRTPNGFELWAARIDPGGAQTYRISAAKLDVRASDGALARLLAFDPDQPPHDVAWAWLPPHEPARPDELVCACEAIRRDQVTAAIEAGCRSVDAVKRATKATFGVCQSRACAGTIAEMLGLAADDPRAAITPRPPLVPVPASILAAFADAGRGEH